MFSNKFIAKNLQSLVLTSVIIISIHSCKSKSKGETDDTHEKYRVINPIVSNSDYVQEYVANIEAIQNVELRAKAKGFVEKIYVDEGQNVSKGQLLFSLNGGESKEEIARAKAQLSAAKSELQQIELELKNTKLLTDKNVISKSELNLIQSKKDAAQAKIQEANATIQMANLGLGFTQIRAPFSGVLGRIPNKVGALIDEGTLLTTLSNNSEIYAYFNVSENDYLKYITQKDKNNSVKLKLVTGDILPQSGLIETIDGQIDPNTGNLSFRARFPNTQKWLKHGSSGKVLVSNILQNAILIPQQSTFEVQENLYVYIVNANNIVEQRKIIPQMRLGEMYVVSDGLSASDKVLYDGVQLVKDGDKIVPDFKNYNQISNNQKP